MILIVCSLEDVSSRNMASSLTSRGEWSDLGAEVLPEGLQGLMRSDDMVLAQIPGIHIRTDDIDKMVSEVTGYSFSEMIFLSRHKAASAIPTLTIHPIGNYGKADFGGRDGQLVPSSPQLMTEVLRRMVQNATSLPYEVSFEVTHHGPWASIPTMFLEIGSDETHWGDLSAAEVLVDSLLEAEKPDHPSVIGIGGGHYAPQFTETALSRRISFGHMIPNYALAGKDDESVVSMVTKAAEASFTRTAYIHKKSMKRSQASHLQSLIESAGVEVISSKDMDPL